MSLLQFIASDEPLKNVKNPYIKFMSINQAIQSGHTVQEWILSNPNIDRDDESILLFCDSMEHMHELEISQQDLSLHTKEYSCKKCYSEITWMYTDERAEQLLEYIHNHLKHSCELELWRIWMDDYAKPTIYKIQETELTLEHIRKFFKQDGFFKPECMIITK